MKKYLILEAYSWIGCWYYVLYSEKGVDRDLVIRVMKNVIERYIKEGRVVEFTDVIHDVKEVLEKEHGYREIDAEEISLFHVLTRWTKKDEIRKYEKLLGKELTERIIEHNSKKLDF